jgi:aldehyde oxidoreductase
MVIVNGKTALACIARVAKLDGAEVITIEGLGTPDNPHVIQEAFVLAGAVQCGFCTPGTIMGAKALLDKNSDPSKEEIKKALARNLCRCTGYAKIIDAVQLAGRFLRGEITPDEVRPDPSKGVIGVSLPRPTSMVKACGTAVFVNDICIEGTLELVAVRSPHAHAFVRSIDVSAAEKMSGVAGVLTASDIRGTNRYEEDRQILVDKEVHVMGDAVAVVAAETKAQALAAAKMVKVDYEVLPAVMTPEESLAEGAVRVHEGRANLAFTLHQVKGDAKAALDASHTVLESEFSTSCIHQAPVEPMSSLAYLEGEGDDAKLVVIGRSNIIHHHLKTLQDALGWEDIRYEEAFSGGQFGLGLDMTVEGFAGAAVLHFRRPAHYACSQNESMWITTKRHPYRIKIRLGADESGKFTGLDIDIIVENGAYTSLGKGAVIRSFVMLSGPYQIPNVNAFARLAYTNNAWGGAARGAGPPQSNYAMESAIDLLAAKLKMDPLEIRRINALLPGQSLSTGQVIEDEWPFAGCVETLTPHYKRAKKDASAFKTGVVRRGVGVAAAAHAIGGGLFGPDTAMVAVELDPDNGITVYGGVADPGEGNDAMLSQIAAHAMGVPIDKVRLVLRDTDRTPVTGAAAGSRMTWMAGNALLLAVEQLKNAMAGIGAKTYDELKASGKPLRYLGRKMTDTNGVDLTNGQGRSHETRTIGIQMAEVEVNTKTGEARVLKMTAIEDIGTVINPHAVEGQMEGGIDMGAGMALREQYIHGKSTDFRTLGFPTMKTSFDIETINLQTYRKKGPLGATGVGEFVLLPTAAAILNAIEDATGARVYDLPATPERVKAAIARLKNS